MKKTINLVFCSVLLCLSAAIAHQANADDLTKNLTSDSWVKTLGGGGMTEQYIYTFSKNGGYESQMITDYNTKPVVGTWRLVKAKDGRTHLVLLNALKQYYWLQQDSVIGYDRKKDLLRISGAAYVGVQQLSRQRRTP